MKGMCLPKMYFSVTGEHYTCSVPESDAPQTLGCKNYFDLFRLHNLQIYVASIVRAATAVSLAHEGRALSCHLLRTGLHHSREERARA
jgi:hypothetical protein